MVTFRRHLPTALFVLAQVLSDVALYCLGMFMADKAPIAYAVTYGVLTLLLLISAVVAYRYRPDNGDTKNTSLIGQLANNYARAGDTSGLEIVKDLASHDRGAK